MTLPTLPALSFLDWLSLFFINNIYQSTILFLIYQCFKFVCKFCTNTTELSRICAAGSVQYADGLSNGFYEGVEVGAKVGERFIGASPGGNGLDDKRKGDIVVSVSADTVFRVDKSILFSKELASERRELETKVHDLDAVLKSILVKKRFPHNGSPTSLRALVLRECLTHITSSYKLIEDIYERTNTPFDSTNKAHERNLMTVWEVLMPHEKLKGRVSAQWKDIGFQGVDPATDFRGMGILSLDDLVYLVTKHPQSATAIFRSSRNSMSSYPFVLAGMHITRFAVQILQTRRLQYFLFTYGSTEEAYHEFFVYLFKAFDKFWTFLEHQPHSILGFESKFKEFERLIEQRLMYRTLVLKDRVAIGGVAIERRMPTVEEEDEEEESEEEEVAMPFTVRRRKNTF